MIKLECFYEKCMFSLNFRSPDTLAMSTRWSSRTMINKVDDEVNKNNSSYYSQVDVYREFLRSGSARRRSANVCVGA